MPEVDFHSLLAQAAELVGSDLTPMEDGVTQALEFHYPDGNSQRAFVTRIDGSERFQLYSPDSPQLALVYSRIGPFTSVVDPHALLQRASTNVYARIVADRSESPPDLLVEACHPLANLTPTTLAAMLQEVADYAETFEDELFGVDQE